MKVLELAKADAAKKRGYAINCFCGAQLEVERGSLRRSLNHRGGELAAVYHAICPECGNIHEVTSWWHGTEEALEIYPEGVPVKVIRPAETSPRAHAKDFVCRHCQTGLEGIVPREIGHALEYYQDEPSTYVYYFICIACDRRNSLIPWWLLTDRQRW